jgi:DtxR family Mn-dependent transcriptional regulator
MTEILTHSIQNYLKVIYNQTDQGQPANTTALATRLGVAPASVTGMLQHLAGLQPALVSYHKYQGVKLTNAGERAALGVIRRHRLIETWLVQSLGYSWDEVHVEAEKLEHAISPELEERIAAALGYPIKDPHGEPIPGADLTMPADLAVSLSILRQPQRARILRVRADDPALLRHLDQLGLVLGAELEVLSFSPFDHNLQLRLAGNDQTLVVGTAVTSCIFVEIIQ